MCGLHMWHECHTLLRLSHILMACQDMNPCNVLLDKNPDKRITFGTIKFGTIEGLNLGQLKGQTWDN